MIPIAPNDLIARLDDLVAGIDRGVLAFDADGTLWQGDVGDDFFEALLARGDVLPEAQVEIAGELARAGLPRPEPEDAPLAIFDAYHGDCFDEERFYEVVAWAAAGRTRREVADYADRVQAERGLDQRLHGEVRPVLEWAKAKKIDVFVVSASPRIVVQRGVTRLPISPDNVFGAEARFDGERMKADAIRPIPYGQGKVTALRAAIRSRPVLAAFGDNVFDLQMLSEARLPVIVRPKPRMLARAAELTSFFALQATM